MAQITDQGWEGPERRGDYQNTVRKWKKDETVNRVLLTITSLALASAIAMAGWSLRKVYDHEIRIVKIESNRFTQADGSRLRRELQQGIPPAWLIEKINTLEKKVDDLRYKGP